MVPNNRHINIPLRYPWTILENIINRPLDCFLSPRENNIYTYHWVAPSPFRKLNINITLGCSWSPFRKWHIHIMTYHLVALVPFRKWHVYISFSCSWSPLENDKYNTYHWVAAGPLKKWHIYRSLGCSWFVIFECLYGVIYQIKGAPVSLLYQNFLALSLLSF